MNSRRRLSQLMTASVLLVSASMGLQANEPAAFVQFVRPLGMGGAFTAVADDNNIFSYNPAGMVQRTGGEYTLANVAVGASKDTKDMMDFLDAHKDQLNNYENLTTQEQVDLANQINAEAVPLHPHVSIDADVASYVSGPHFLGMPMHVGFGAMGVADGTFKLDPVVVTSTSTAPNPTVSYDINADLVIPVSIAHRFDAPWVVPGKIGLGVTGKFISRGQIHQEHVSINNSGEVTTPDPSKGHGLGADVGVLYQPTDRLNVGLMVQDFMGTKIKYDALAAKDIYPAVAAYSNIIKPRTNLGLAYTPSTLFWLLPTGNRLMLAVDMRDVTQDHQDPWGHDFWFHAKAGAEYRWWFFRFRGGIADRYPSFGLGLDIPFIKIDYAFYSRELGSTIGTTREQNHVISLAIKFGTGATEERERIGKGARAKEDSQTGVPTQAEPAAPAAAPASAPAAAPAQAPAPATPAANPAPAKK